MAVPKVDQEMQVDEAGPSKLREEIQEMAEAEFQPTTETRSVVEEKNMTGVEASSREEMAEPEPQPTTETRLAEESVEEKSMTGVEDSSRSKSTSEQDEERLCPETKKMTMEERKAKFDELRKKMVRVIVNYQGSIRGSTMRQAESSRANRASLVDEAAKAKVTARDAARLERQRKLAELLRTKADAEDRGEDVERQKNWEYTIEENEEWEKKLSRKKRRADFEFHGEQLYLYPRLDGCSSTHLSFVLDDAHAARRKYKKDLDSIKPDLAAYNKQKALAMSQGSGTLSAFNSTGVSDLTVTSEEQRLAAENLYRDANTLIYGDSKPSEDAIDRVVGKLNQEYVAFLHAYGLA